MNKKYLFALIVISVISCQASQNIKDPLVADSQLIDYLFSEYTGHTPGISCLVIKKGEIIFEESRGYADIEKNIKTNSNTNYRIASVSKQFTAMAIMILVDQGKLSYETSLTEIFPEFPTYGEQVNVRHLLSNQSGIVDYYDFFDEDSEIQATDQEVLDGLMKVDSTYFIPGSQTQYSNAGYALLSLIVAKISGRTFAEFMSQEIFEKLKMSRTKVFELHKPIQNRAYGYSIDNDSIIFNDQSVTSAIQGDGGIYSNIMDYYKWDQALYTDQLIPLDKMQDAFNDWDDNTKTDKDGYGYGWYVDSHNDTKILNHSGGTAGFEARITRIPSLQLTIVLFSNHDSHDRNLWHTANALRSIYSNYKIPMPLEIKLKEAIDQNGIDHGIVVYDKLKDNVNYLNDETTLNYLGFEYRRIQKEDKAKVLFEKAIDEFPNYFGGYYGLGITYKGQNEYDKAISNFEKVIELGTDDEPGVLDRAKAHLKSVLEMKATAE